MNASGASLQAGILAAGRGERLRTGGSNLKPLVKVAGETLIERVLSSMSEAGASEVVVIINEDSLAVRHHVAALKWPFVLSWIVETTPTSMHSFLRLVETLAADGDDGPFLLSTVDTVAGAQTFARFIAQARRHEAAVTLALTAPGDDEKPLLVRCTQGNSRIIALGAAATPSDYATAGLYAVRGSILREAEAARREGVDALRTFLGRLLDRGYHLAGIPIAQSIDVDRPRDIRTAEEFLRTTAV
jgi:NDP-sugar pyrophosphorylase family protein